MKNKAKPSMKSEKITNDKLYTKISVILNCILIGGMFTIFLCHTVFHVFDFEIANQGERLMCESIGFKEKAFSHLNDAIELKRAYASIDFRCAQNNAGTYYREGLIKYFDSLGLSEDLEE